MFFYQKKLLFWGSLQSDQKNEWKYRDIVPLQEPAKHAGLNCGRATDGFAISSVLAALTKTFLEKARLEFELLLLLLRYSSK